MDVKKDPTTSRTLIAKAVGYKAGRRKNWQGPRVDEALRTVLAQSPSIGSRHHPAKGKIQKGDHCVFINRATDFGTGGILIEICSYTQGHIPESMTPDLEQSQADIKVVELKDEEGKAGELVHSMRCIALGQVIIMESTRGHGGGAAAVQKILTALFRRHLADPNHPSVDLADIGSPDLRELIESRGGVSRVTAKITDATPISGSHYSGMLSGTRGQVGGASNCTVTWEAKTTLNTDTSVELLEESEDETLAGVTLYFKLGGSISDLSKYRERRSVHVHALPDGRPVISAVENALRDYLDTLRMPAANGKSTISTDGTLQNTKIVSAGN